MDNNSIVNGFQYTIAIMLVLLVLVFWQVYFIHRPKINTLQLEHDSGISCSTIEGMHGASDVFGQNLRYQTEQSGPLANPGYVKGFAGVGQQKSGFFGGSEPPVFYDIGNIQAARAMRSKSGYKYSSGGGEGHDGVSQKLDDGYSIVQKDGKGVLFKDGLPLTDTSHGGVEQKHYYKTGRIVDRRAEWKECPTAAHRTSADGYSCYLPEGMSDPLAITTSGFGRRDPFEGIEQTVYGG